MNKHCNRFSVKLHTLHILRDYHIQASIFFLFCQQVRKYISLSRQDITFKILHVFIFNTYYVSTFNFCPLTAFCRMLMTSQKHFFCWGAWMNWSDSIFLTYISALVNNKSLSSWTLSSIMQYSNR